jgi:hypothetical protein
VFCIIIQHLSLTGSEETEVGKAADEVSEIEHGNGGNYLEPNAKRGLERCSLSNEGKVV